MAGMVGLQACSDDFTEPPIPEGQGGFVGDGSWNKPFSAWQVNQNALNPKYPTSAWSTGYIVGSIVTENVFTVNEETAKFDPSVSVTNTNLLLSWVEPEEFKAIPDSEKWEYTCSVQISGEVRNALNLADNPDNQYKLVSICGRTGENYLGIGGIRDVTAYAWGDKGIEPETQPLPDAVGGFYQNFQDYASMAQYQRQGWSNEITLGDFAGWLLTADGVQNYMSADASLAWKQGGPYAATLLSPQIDMSLLQKKTLDFDVEVLNPGEHSSLLVYAVTRTAEPSEENTLGSWSAPVYLPFAMPEGAKTGYGEWTTVSGIDLSGLSGIVRIGWEYRSENGGMSNCSTFAIDNVNVGGMPKPADVLETLLTTATGITGWTFDNIYMEQGLSYVWSWDTSHGTPYLYGTAYSGSSFEATSYAISPVISLKDCTESQFSFMHAAKYQRNIRQLCGVAVREAGTTEWTELEIPQWPENDFTWTFASSGIIDISAFDGKDVQIGFKYESDQSNADSWEIRDLKVMGKRK